MSEQQTEKKKGRGGRKSKLTDEVQDRILQAVKAGNYLEIAAEYAGIGTSTLYRWLEWGEAGRKRYKEFRDALVRARAEAEARNVTIIQKAAKDDWRAAAWFLERSFAERWRNRQQHEHVGADGGPIETNVTVRFVHATGDGNADG